MKTLLNNSFQLSCARVGSRGVELLVNEFQVLSLLVSGMSASIGSSKIQASDLSENFEHLVSKVRGGICCMPGCSDPSCLVNHDRSCPPYLCRKHLTDGSDTHFGSWVATSNQYYEKWDCCGTNWKLCRCQVLEDQFRALTDIPVTEEQTREADAVSARLVAQQEENERYERMINAGRDEAYDR